MDETARAEPRAGAFRVAARPRRSQPTLWQLWLAGFLCAALVAVTVQFVVLPYLVPELHGGHGLLEGLDSQAFHSIAVDRARRIRTEGWSAWQLRPLGQSPAGIASAVYAVTVPEPWTLIPLNAALHATAALVLLRIVERFVPDRRRAVLAVLPFFFYPSAMTWYAQLHKDGMFILGSLLFAWGWMELVRLETWRGGVGVVGRWVVLVVLGVLVSHVAREYSVLILGILAKGLVLGLMVVWVWRGIAERKMWRAGVPAVVGAWLVVGVLVVMTPSAGKGVSSEVPTPARGRFSRQPDRSGSAPLGCRGPLTASSRSWRECGTSSGPPIPKPGRTWIWTWDSSGRATSWPIFRERLSSDCSAPFPRAGASRAPSPEAP